MLLYYNFVTAIQLFNYQIQALLLLILWQNKDKYAITCVCEFVMMHFQVKHIFWHSVIRNKQEALHNVTIIWHMNLPQKYITGFTCLSTEQTFLRRCKLIYICLQNNPPEMSIIYLSLDIEFVLLENFYKKSDVILVLLFLEAQTCY